MKSHERFYRALALLGLNGSERCLELGCGAGLFAGLVAEQLQDGSVTAVDRSEAMIRATLKRNAAHIDAGRLEALCCDILDLDSHPQRYDRILSFNVNVFLDAGAEEWAVVRKLLAPEGKLCFFYQPPFDKTQQLLEALLQGLEVQGYSVQESGREQMGGAMACYAIAEHQSL